MELITLTSEITDLFGLYSAHITIEGNDYIIQIKQLNDSRIIFTCPNIEFQYGQTMQLVFQTNQGKVKETIMIDCFYDNGIMLVVEAVLKTHEHCFFNFLREFLKHLLEQKKRKEQRILCTKHNLETLNLINTFMFEFKYRALKGVIKDISFSGINVLTSPILLQENGDLFNFKLKFINPTESFLFVKCPIIRKNLYTFENKDFAEVVFKLEENLKFRNRLDNYFSLQAKTNHIRKV